METGGIVGRALLAAGVLAGVVAPSVRGEALPLGGSGSCALAAPPFAEVAGADLTRRPYTSEDEEPVAYEIWSGTVPSFDGLPLSVDVTVPCRAAGEGRPAAADPRPTVAMLHGFTDDKHVWEETGKSDTVESTDRPGANTRWNNIWFASRGYVTLTYTARGWHDSCGPDTPGNTATGPAPACAGKQYWIHLDDKRWEVRDAQWLTAGLVQSGVADPQRLAITGGSYGGRPPRRPRCWRATSCAAVTRCRSTSARTRAQVGRTGSSCPGPRPTDRRTSRGRPRSRSTRSPICCACWRRTAGGPMGPLANPRTTTPSSRSACRWRARCRA
ncbi:alpha/beta hydrolase family protein [Aquihabitans daechungensis]|uniref:alpha/beta hydrolase family protein n=1 Tax=Aquihabitans daechungensis TaxID=1052257 RepID=UPI003B9EDE9D